MRFDRSPRKTPSTTIQTTDKNRSQCTVFAVKAEHAENRIGRYMRQTAGGVLRAYDIHGSYRTKPRGFPLVFVKLVVDPQTIDLSRIRSLVRFRTEIRSKRSRDRPSRVFIRNFPKLARKRAIRLRPSPVSRKNQTDVYRRTSSSDCTRV